MINTAISLIAGFTFGIYFGFFIDDTFKMIYEEKHGYLTDEEDWDF